MGDPKRQRKKYSGPLHPWVKERIEEERETKRQYGVRRKNEIWKMDSFLRNMLRRAKVIIGARTQQAEVEKAQLLHKAHSLGFIQKGARIEDILNIKLKDVMDRRLQTILVKKNMARTVGQARQFIVHGHVNVGDKRITSPSYLVKMEEEASVAFHQISALSSPDHAERSKKAEKKEQKRPEGREERRPRRQR